jgi:hypothetical protein
VRVKWERGAGSGERGAGSGERGAGSGERGAVVVSRFKLKVLKLPQLSLYQN